MSGRMTSQTPGRAALPSTDVPIIWCFVDYSELRGAEGIEECRETHQYEEDTGGNERHEDNFAIQSKPWRRSED